MFAGMDLSECKSGWFQAARRRLAGQLQELVLQMMGTKPTGSSAVRHLS